MALVELHGVTLDVAEKGTGRPLLFLHAGYPAGRRGEAEACIARLSVQGYNSRPQMDLLVDALTELLGLGADARSRVSERS